MTVLTLRESHFLEPTVTVLLPFRYPSSSNPITWNEEKPTECLHPSVLYGESASVTILNQQSKKAPKACQIKATLSNTSTKSKHPASISNAFWLSLSIERSSIHLQALPVPRPGISSARWLICRLEALDRWVFRGPVLRALMLSLMVLLRWMRLRWRVKAVKVQFVQGQKLGRMGRSLQWLWLSWRLEDKLSIYRRDTLLS